MPSDTDYSPGSQVLAMSSRVLRGRGIKIPNRNHLTLYHEWKAGEMASIGGMLCIDTLNLCETLQKVTLANGACIDVE